MKGGRGGAAPAATPCPSLLVQTLYIAFSLHICLMLLVIILAWGPESHLGGRSPGRHPSPKVCPSGTHVGCNCKRDSNRSTIRSTEIMAFRHFCSGHDPAWRSPRGHLAVTRNPLGEIHPPPRYLPHTPLSPLLWKCWIFWTNKLFLHFKFSFLCLQLFDTGTRGIMCSAPLPSYAFYINCALRDAVFVRKPATAAQSQVFRQKLFVATCTACTALRCVALRCMRCV